MSITFLSEGQSPSARLRVTTTTVHDKKQRHEPITCLTAYDYATARLVDEAGIDIILVGDTLAQVVLGYDTTLPVTLEEMLHHTRAVRRAVKSALVVGDMPFGTYQGDAKEGVANAVRFVKEAGAEAIKLEGGDKRVDLRAQCLPCGGVVGPAADQDHRTRPLCPHQRDILPFLPLA